MGFLRTSNRWAAIGIAALASAGCGDNIHVSPAANDPVKIDRQEQAFVEALKPLHPGRPVIAVVGLNEGTETTDFLLPHAVLQRADVADVQHVTPHGGRVVLYPTLQVEKTQDFATFDQTHLAGADYVIVPAMSNNRDPAIMEWLKQQAAHGSRIIGVCAGALVVANAGLLEDRHFTTHWYYRSALLKQHPSAVYIPHRRYVIDGNVATTTGITASVPTMIALVEAIGGRQRAQALASELGVSSWNPAHDSSLFGLTAARAFSYLMNKAAFWRHEQWIVDVQDGMDDMALAFAADAWSRTGRVSVKASAPGPVKLRSGAILFAEPGAPDLPHVPLTPSLKPMEQLDQTLCEIGDRFGRARRDWVMMELEYARTATACGR